MLHCLVFKEQLFVFRSLPSFEMLCFKRLIYCTTSLLDCQELFYFSFLSERQPIASCKLFPLKEPCLAFHAGRYLAATCIILQDGGAFVNTYFSKSVIFWAAPLQHIQSNKKRIDCSMRHNGYWWRHRDLNSGHCGYEPHALANWAMPPRNGG